MSVDVPQAQPAPLVPPARTQKGWESTPTAPCAPKIPPRQPGQPPTGVLARPATQQPALAAQEKFLSASANVWRDISGETEGFVRCSCPQYYSICAESSAAV